MDEQQNNKARNMAPEPGQGNSNQAVVRRYGRIAEKRGARSQQMEDQHRLTKIEERIREGSQGDSLGQHTHRDQ